MTGYLLDTHILLWWLLDRSKLSRDVHSAIESPENIIVVSAVCVWEISIKRRSGRLQAPNNLLELIELNEFATLPISAEHCLRIGELPDHHQDPFDRMLVAQALAENLTLISRDSKVHQYDVPLLKA